MIHNASNHPVLIKKIGLKIWTLRAEIEAVIAKRVSTLDENADNAQDPQHALEELHQEYLPGGNAQNLIEFPRKAPPSAAAETVPTPPAETPAESAPANQEVAATDTAPPAAANPFQDVIENQAPAEAPANTTARPMDSTPHNDEEVVILQRRPPIPEDQLFSGKTLLSEVYMDRIHFFCDESFLEGQSIVIQFQIPQCFALNADVMYCRRYGMKSRIISENKFLYRVAARFTYLRPGERTLLRRFLQSVEPNIAEQLKAKAVKEAQAAPAKEGGDDVMGDLDNLDL